MADLLETLANGVYEFGKNYIEDRNNRICAKWEDDELDGKGKWKYFRVGTYYEDEVHIDIEALDRLKRFCEAVRSTE